MAGRTLVVGDIHGCFEELQQLLRLARLASDDVVVSVGDLIDRGPRSWEVVERFASDPEHHLAVLGNHEEKHLRGDRNETDDPSGRITRHTTPQRHYEMMLAYFRTLPLYLDLPEALVVHAGLLPGVPLAEQPGRVLTGRGSQGRCGFDGHSPWWFESPALPVSKPVVFGHSVFAAVSRGPHERVWGLDTGAAVGGALTGLLLPGFEILQVPTPDYYGEALRRWAPIFLLRDLPHLPWHRVLAFDPQRWPIPVRDALLGAHETWRLALGQIADDVAGLRRYTAYDTLPPEQRAALSQRLRRHKTLGTPYGRALLRCFPGGAKGALVAKTWPDLRAAEAALAGRVALDLEALSARLGDLST